MSSLITGATAWEVLDSRGNPTLACEVRLEDGTAATAAVPSGASTGRHEACELRDGDPARYGGRGVLTAADNVEHELTKVIVGRDADDQVGLDEAMRDFDGTSNLERLGANAVLAVSLAAAIAAAASKGIPLYEHLGEEPLLPLPMVNIISGGAHAGGLLDVQDLLVVPVGAESFAEALEWAVRVRAATAELAHAAGLPADLVADEGGIAGPLPSNRAGLELLLRGIETSGLVPGEEAAIAMDIAATQFRTADGRYRFATEDRELSAAELVGELATWCADFPIVSLEDVLGEDDWDAWREATPTLGRIQLLGDDLFVTNPERLERGIGEGVGNAVLVKVNQNGTLSGAADVVRRAKEAGFATVVSARSGETEDAWLADLAVGWRAGQVKVGSTTRSERTAKWNRLLRIERELDGRAPFAGRAALGGRKD